MTITRVGSETTQVSSVNNTGFTFNHTTVSGQSLLLLAVHLEGGETVTGLPTFDGGNFVLIAESTAQANADTRSWLFGIVSPNVGALEVVVVFSPANPSTCACINYAGTKTVDVATAVNLIEEVQNLDATFTTVFASADEIGADDILFASYVFQGANGSPISVSTGWGEIYDLTTGGSASSDFATGSAEEFTPPNGLTVTWDVEDDENGGMLCRIVDAATVLARRHQQTMLVEP